MKKILLAFLLIGFLLFVISCSRVLPLSSDVNGTDISEPTKTNRIALPSPSPKVIETATLGINKNVTAFFRNNGNCLVPCILGIKLGESQLSAIEQIMSSINAKMIIRDFGEGLMIDNHISIPESDLKSALGVYIENEVAEALSFYLIGTDFQLVDYYLIENFLLREGLPSNVWINVGVSDLIERPNETAFTLLIYYEKTNLIYVSYGTTQLIEEAYVICAEEPNKNSTQGSKDLISLSLYLGNRDKFPTPNSIVNQFQWEVGEISDQEGSMFSPISLNTKETVGSFYEGVIAPGSEFCFDWVYPED